MDNLQDLGPDGFGFKIFLELGLGHEWEAKGLR